jgi:hypothetical protein
MLYKKHMGNICGIIQFDKTTNDIVYFRELEKIRKKYNLDKDDQNLLTLNKKQSFLI